MKALVFHTYGDPSSSRIEEVADPVPQPGRIVVKVAAVSLNAADWRILHAEPFIVRFVGFGFMKPKKGILGADVAGTVTAVGEGVTEFAPGDEVIGDLSESGFGGLAELAAGPASAFTKKPEGVSFEQGATCGIAASTALRALRQGECGPGKSVLVVGASGGVGSFAVQMARAMGAALVTAVCGPGKEEFVRSLGADEVIDRTAGDYTAAGKRYDLIVDTARNRPLTSLKRALNPGGRYLFVGGKEFFGTMVMMPLLSTGSDRKMSLLSARANRDDVAEAASMIAAGKVTPAIDVREGFDAVAPALVELRDGRARGKIVVRIQ